MVERRSSCIRRLAGTRALEMQITRFLRNRAVTAGEISAHAAAGTAARVAGREVVAIQDTSELALGGRRARANGYGPVGKGGGVRGLLLHAVLAVDAASGAVLGLVDANVWNRTGGKVSSRRARQTAEKESQRWIDATRRASDVLASACHITSVSDRESDIYQHIASAPPNVDVILRACQNRKIVPKDEDQAALLFQSVRELLINASKYAGTGAATVTLECRGDQLRAWSYSDPQPSKTGSNCLRMLRCG